jgi:hypothetical protein
LSDDENDLPDGLVGYVELDLEPVAGETEPALLGVFVERPRWDPQKKLWACPWAVWVDGKPVFGMQIYFPDSLSALLAAGTMALHQGVALALKQSKRPLAAHSRRLLESM